jgi:hypothetical protein
METTLNFTVNFKNATAVYFAFALMFGVGAISAGSLPPGDMSMNDANLTNDFPSARLLQTAVDWRNLRYRLDYSLSDPMDKDTEFYLKRILIDPIMVKLRRMIKVTGALSIPKFNSTMCTSEENTNQLYKVNDIDTDLLILVNVKNIPQNVIAMATGCVYSKIDRRPLVGMLIINSNYILKQYSSIEVLKSAYMHELFHVLAFNYMLYDYFPIGKKSTYVKQIRTTAAGTFEVFKIITPGLVKYGKEYFNCEKFDGIIMEDQGGSSANSHFEQKVLNDEMMISLSNSIGILSMFSLHFLNDVGWYQVNFGFAQEYNWGRGKGCQFLEPACNNSFSEFCTSQYQVKCSDDRKSKRLCLTTSFSNNCPLSTKYAALDCANTLYFKSMLYYEESGLNSLCLDVDYYGNLGAGCFKTFCEPSRIKITIGSMIYYCDGSKNNFQHYEMIVSCPPFDVICKNEPQPVLSGAKTSQEVDNLPCSGGCNGNGICLSTRGVCECYAFYMGNNCEQYTGCDYGDSLCQKINPYAH